MTQSVNIPTLQGLQLTRFRFMSLWKRVHFLHVELLRSTDISDSRYSVSDRRAGQRWWRPLAAQFNTMTLHLHLALRDLTWLRHHQSSSNPDLSTRKHASGGESSSFYFDRKLARSTLSDTTLEVRLSYLILNHPSALQLNCAFLGCDNYCLRVIYHEWIYSIHQVQFRC